VTEFGSSIHEVFIMMKMLEMQMGQLVEHPMGNKRRISETTPRSREGEGYANSFGRDGGSH
jgi:hypothetical protein